MNSRSSTRTRDASSASESIGARRVCELGSAIGYSTAFFAKAVGAGGKVVYTDGSEKNAREASGYLERLGLRDRVDVKVGEAVELLESTTGEFDVIFLDIDKDGYPRALEAAAPRVRRSVRSRFFSCSWASSAARLV